MARRIGPLILIFFCSAIAWMVLGQAIFLRTGNAEASLQGRVVSTWGAPQEQVAPSASAIQRVRTVVLRPPPQVGDISPSASTSKDASGSSREARPGDAPVRTVVERQVLLPLPIESSRIAVSLDLDPRQKGLLWYSTYGVGFDGTFLIRNTTQFEEVKLCVKLPLASATYDDFRLSVDGAELPTTFEQGSAVGSTRIAKGATVLLRFAYKSRGLASWRYLFGSDAATVRDFQLTMTTNFKAIDFADGTLSPTDKLPTPAGWRLQWSYNNLVSGTPIGMVMPEKLQPGPVAGRISLFAPVSLFFFFFLLFLITTIRGIQIHPMNYFFLAAAFFSFHLLLAYLVDHVSIGTAFAVCSAVSLFLVISYLRLVVGMRFAALEAGLAQLVYLVLFSYAFFFKGFTGLTVTIGSILTLFIVMQLTGRVRWAEKFAGSSRSVSPPPVPVKNPPQSSS